MAEIPEIIAYAGSLQIAGSSPVDDDQWQKALSDFFNELGRIYKGEAGVTIGHIKGFLRLANGDYAYFSTVGSAAGVSCRFAKGEPANGQTLGAESTRFAENADAQITAILDFNIIVLGLAEARILALLQPAVSHLADDLKADIQLTKAVPKNTGGFKKK